MFGGQGDLEEIYDLYLVCEISKLTYLVKHGFGAAMCLVRHLGSDKEYKICPSWKFLAHLWHAHFSDFFSSSLECFLCCIFVSPPGGLSSKHWLLRMSSWFPHLHPPLSFCKDKFFFYSGFIFTAKLKGRYRGSPYTPCPHICITSLIFNIPHQSATYVTTDEPTLNHYNHPKSVVHIRSHSWCCTFYWFGPVYNELSVHH